MGDHARSELGRLIDKRREGMAKTLSGGLWRSKQSGKAPQTAVTASPNLRHDRCEKCEHYSWSERYSVGDVLKYSIGVCGVGKTPRAVNYDCTCDKFDYKPTSRRATCGDCFWYSRDFGICREMPSGCEADCAMVCCSKYQPIWSARYDGQYTVED